MAQKQRWEEKYEEYKSKMPNLTVDNIQQELKSKQEEYARKLAGIRDETSEEYRKIVKDRKDYIKENENAQENLETII